MEPSVVECEPAQRDREPAPAPVAPPDPHAPHAPHAPQAPCVCRGGPTLAILKDVQRLYEERMDLLERVGGSNKLQLQVDLLRAWVGDLVGQNTLLTRAVEELEAEATTKLLLERRRHSELLSESRAECGALRRRLTRKDSDLRGLVEVLRRLREFDYCTLDGIHFFEVTESDIFGSVEWRQKKLEEGDFKRHMKHDTYKRDSKKICRCSKVNELKMLNESLHKENVAKEREIRQLNKDAQQYEQTILNLRNEMSLTNYNTPDVSKKDAEVMAGMCCTGTGTESGDWEPVKDYSEMLRGDAVKYQQRMHKMETNLKSSGESVLALRKVNVSLSEEAAALRRVCAALDEQCHVAHLRAHFKDDIIREMRNQLRHAKAKASTSYHVATSTPNVSCNVCEGTDVSQCPDVSLIVIERSVSGPILVSDESIADLAKTFRKKCTCRSKPSSSKQEDTPRTSCCALETIQAKDKCEECVEGIDELFFNTSAKKSDSSGPPGRCITEECSRTYEMRTAPSMLLTKVEKEVMNRSCGRIVKDSGGSCSLADSATGTCDAARAHYYHNKLLSTLQILQNKEETIRVQAESLAVAEARIAALTARAAGTRNELDRKTKELNSLRKTMDHCKLDTADVSVMAETQEGEDRRDVVNMLQNNLCIIEDLYRECFYETAKQESLIEMLRSSCLDVRLSERRKADQLGRLQHVVHSQQFSLDKCQDLAMEVDSLKTEISNFLNNSNNNDSGMWEVRSEPAAAAAGAGAGGCVQDELQDIMDQLLRLRGMLASGCICGLQEENMRLKQSNETMDVKIGELKHNISELESELQDKDHADVRYKEDIEIKEKELLEIRRQLAAVQEGSRDQSSTCDILSVQLQQAQAHLQDKTAELAQIREQNEVQESTIKQLKQELERADQIIKENCKIRSEVSYLTTQVSLWRDQLADSERRVCALDAELCRTRKQCKHIDACYREKASSVAELQTQLEAAHARGAELCGEARRAVAAVRCWVRRMRDKHREQETIIKEKETILTELQQRIEERECDIQSMNVSENETSCSKCSSHRNDRRRSGPRELPSCCPKVGKRRIDCGTSGSEIASCSSAPVPPRRLLRMKLCESKPCGYGSRNASVQQPVRCEASTSANTSTRESEPAPAPAPAAAAAAAAPCCPQYDTRHVRVRVERAPRDVSPTEELFLRVEQLSEALADGQRRWATPRARPRGPHPR